MRQRSLATATISLTLIEAGRLESQYLVGSAAPGGHSISKHRSGVGLIPPVVTVGGAHAQAGEAGTHRAAHSLPPAYRAQILRAQAQGKLPHRKRLMPSVAAQ